MSRKMKHTSKRAFVRVCATALSCVLLLAMLPLMRSALADDTQYATVIVDSCNVRNKAGTVNTTVIGVLRSGGRVHVYDVVTLSNDPSGYNKWCHVKYSSNGQQFDGYVVDEFLAKDADINSDPAFETEISGFPDSYKPYLRSLHAKHPMWHFKPVQALKSFDDTVALQTRLGVSLIENSVNDAWKSTEPGAYNWQTGTFTPYDGSSWVNASASVVKHYLDPRNMLSEDMIFQFLNLSYDESTQKIESVKGMLNGTFMQDKTIITGAGTYISYEQAFMSAAGNFNANPIFLAAKVLQEVSASGSNSTSGNYYSTYYKKQYTNLYNYFNVGASSSPDPVAKGLAFARDGYVNADGSINTAKNATYYLPWNTPYKSILGGSRFIADSYLNIGQNTIYQMKFNINPSDGSQYCNHQYMTNIRGAASEGKKMYNAYSKANILNTEISFSIPVYSGLPSSPCVLASPSGNPNAYLSELSVSGYLLTPEFDTMNCTDYYLVVPASCTTVHVDAKPASDKAKVTGIGDIALGDGVNSIDVMCTAENGSSRVYTLNIARNTGAADGYFTTSLPSTENFYGGIEPGTTVAAAKALFTMADGYTLTYVNMNGQGKDDAAAICTGDLIQVEDASGSVVYIGALFIRGDANCDGKISSADLTLISRYILGEGTLSASGMQGADANNDGKINAADLTLISRHILQLNKITQ